MNILICIPSIDFRMNCKLFHTLHNILNIFKKLGIKFKVSFKSGSLINRVRNEFITEFLDGLYTHLFFVDSDLFGFETLMPKLINANKELIGGVYVKKSMKESYNCNLKYSIEETLKEDIAEVKHIPTGLMFIKRSCIKSLIKNYPDRMYKIDNKIHYNLFDSYVCNEVFLSEDYGFCNLYSMIGGKIYCILDSNIVHVGTCEYKGNFNNFLIKKISL